MEALAWMAQALVITLREGIEAALIIVIVLSFLRKTGREELNKHVYRGLFGAVGASLAAAIIFARLGLDPENEALEGAFMLAAAILVGSL
ncbi:MAG: FTR1 family protein, partial [Nitrospinota bacterium]